LARRAVLQSRWPAAMFWARCKAPACRPPCSGPSNSAGDVVKVDLGKVQNESAAKDIAVEAPGAMLAHIKEAARELMGHLADVALEYPHEELVAATGSFAEGHRLGAGGAGAVYRGRLRGGTEVAVKALADLGGLEGFEDEVRVLSRFRHPNLVTLYGWGQHERTKYIVYELLPGGDLQGRLRSRKDTDAPFTWQERLRVAVGAARGLSHMMNSQPKAFHRDIKPPNILLDADGTAKMADFGLAAVVQGDEKESDELHLAVDQVSGTPGYMCPTYMQTRRVTEQSEAYSFGIVLLELLVNKFPALVTTNGSLVFPLMEELRPAAAGAHKRIISSLDQPARWPSPVVEEFADVAVACVDLSPARRPSFKVIVDSLQYLGRHTGSDGGGAPPAAAHPCSGSSPEDAASTDEEGELSCVGSEVATGDEADPSQTQDRSQNRRLWWS